MIEMTMTLTCDGCGKVETIELDPFDPSSPIVEMRKAMFSGYGAEGEAPTAFNDEKRCGSVQLCKECSEAYKRSRAALFAGFAKEASDE